ncbi:proteasome lid subunit RPN8/RPN11 [Methanomicrobium sp. W14]|jgi:proteasome lid subunit RPN8/RPN11|uniref:Mov34/MPN/PAD-1 family protein n=1 Tax=Methanomicrobium sp. W14 TaxID=2817839 RepID=UPI001AEA8344|nr:Mov34/MPN/PAD-1 family protein [Methanomicrobium sp. W14]MBP2133781.1 proteasome lid subunit RPN8/RPN11 [Methanomicrobium sp. W14]
MPDIRIKTEVLKTLLELGKSQHPNEFLAILKEKDGIIHELELAPGTISGRSSARFDTFMLPLGTNTAGSAHSHPSGAVRPSDADLRFFPKVGRYHIIVGAPYTEMTWKCFRANGEPYDLEVI